jgi:hypothetical protein
MTVADAYQSGYEIRLALHAENVNDYRGPAHDHARMVWQRLPKKLEEPYLLGEAAAFATFAGVGN